MGTVNLTDAKAHLTALVERAAAGETVCILRRGKPLAQITAIRVVRRPIDPAELRAVTDRMHTSAQDSGRLVRSMRDDARY